MGATIANRVAEYSRRQDEWDHQAHLATIELKQIDQQLTAAEIRLAVAERELRNHDQQIDNAREADQFLRGKFTNQDLFQWMVGQVSGLYFQSYQLAYDLAKRAELCMQHELGLKYGETVLIRFGYWDSLKKGLLAGDHLAHDLKRLDARLPRRQRPRVRADQARLADIAGSRTAHRAEGNGRLRIRRSRNGCSISIRPVITGGGSDGERHDPVRHRPVHERSLQGCGCSGTPIARTPALAVGYERVPDDDPSGPDGRFIDDRKIIEGDRHQYGPERCGAVRACNAGRTLPAFRRRGRHQPMAARTADGVQDLRLRHHLRRDPPPALHGARRRRSAARRCDHLGHDVAGSATAPPLFRLFSLRHEFPAEWHRFVSSPSSANNTMTIDLAATRFPYFVQIRGITIAAAHAIARSRSPGPIQVAVAPGQAAPDLAQQTWTGQDAPGPWTLGTASDPRLLEDLFIVLAYSAS